MALAKRSVILAGLAAMLLGGLLMTAPPAVARTPFDGSWSVLIATDAGTCDRGYRYALHIVNGRISYDDPSFNISGHVDARGHVNVSVSAGGQQASGSGQLSGDSGQGTWSGRSSTSLCSGHWEAQRRG
jgi:hypothetical protein